MEKFSKRPRRSQPSDAPAPIVEAQPLPEIGTVKTALPAAPEQTITQFKESVFGTLQVTNLPDRMRWGRAVDELMNKRGYDCPTIAAVAQHYVSNFGRAFVEKNGAAGFELAFSMLLKQVNASAQA